MFGIVYVVFHVNMTFIHSEAWPLLSWRGEGGSWRSGAAGSTRRWHRLGRVGTTMGDDLLLLKQPWPPLLARALPMWCGDMQPRAEGSLPGRARLSVHLVKGAITAWVVRGAA